MQKTCHSVIEHLLKRQSRQFGLPNIHIENGQNAIAHCPFRISRILSFDSATA